MKRLAIQAVKNAARTGARLRHVDRDLSCAASGLAHTELSIR